jgi:predicted nucleic acid-binding protein
MLPADVRSIDAIHLVTAQALGRDLAALVSYDQQMIDTARRLGIKTASPS